jgi:hypothetical protein
LELSVHPHDIAAGLGIDFEVPAEVALRLREHTAGWPLPEPPHYEPSTNPWADVLTRFGRQTHS